MSFNSDAAISAVYGKPGRSGKLTVSAVNAESGALKGGRVYMLSPTTDCFISVDAAAAADGTCMFLPGGGQYGFVLGVRGATPKLDVIRASADGTLYYTEMQEIALW